MNYFGSSHDWELTWPVVNYDKIDDVLATLDYYRDAWQDVILYYEKHTNRLFAYDKRGEFHIHPDLFNE